MQTIAPGTESGRVTLLAISTGFSGGPTSARWTASPVTRTATCTGGAERTTVKRTASATSIGYTTTQGCKTTAGRCAEFLPAVPKGKR
jgi:hypothetical protein